MRKMRRGGIIDFFPFLIYIIRFFADYSSVLI